jgi:hypothetical protein
LNRSRAARRATILLAAPCCMPAAAHIFAQPYTLPVPFALYATAATAALLLSFVIVGVFAVVPAVTRARPCVAASPGAPAAAPSRLVACGRMASVFLLTSCIVTGFAGTQNAFLNFNMTFFWIIFVLAVPYVVAVVGDFYASVNPFEELVRWVEAALGAADPPRAWPARLGCFPALAFYMAFIWLELFGQLRPRGLSGALAIYVVINVAGARVFGRQAWFRHAEFFAVYLRLIGRMSPWANVRATGDGASPARRDGRWHAPFSGLLDEPDQSISLVLFILFMLSSTAYDGLHSTSPWISVYWKTLYPAIAPWLHPAPDRQYILSSELYYLWQWSCLFASPFLYLAVFASCVGVMKAVTRSSIDLLTLVTRFSMSLVPIAFVYHVTHYYTLLLAQGGQIVRLVSDPFGTGWNLLGTARLPLPPVMLDMGSVWLTQVALILAGHIVGVLLAHVEALRIFGSPKRAALSQLPMLALMVLFTNFGLWILSLPISGAG